MLPTIPATLTTHHDTPMAPVKKSPKPKPKPLPPIEAPVEAEPVHAAAPQQSQAVQKRWDSYHELIASDKEMWRTVPLADGYKLLADVRLSAERGATILRERENVEQGDTVTCIMASESHVKANTVPGTCRGTFPRDQFKFKRDRIIDGQVVSYFICSEKCYTAWRQEVQREQTEALTTPAPPSPMVKQ